MSAPIPHVRAWFAVVAVDWPPGSAKRWPGRGMQSLPMGPHRPAELTVVAQDPTAARVEVACMLAEAGHKWHAIVHIQRRPEVEQKAAELVAEALERAAHDSRMAADLRKAAQEGLRNNPFHTAEDFRKIFLEDDEPKKEGE